MLETERLSFRPFVPDDLPLLIEQRSDPDVYRYLGGTRRQNPEKLAERLEFSIECHKKLGFGMSAAILKETSEIIGSAGLQPFGEGGEIEVGYTLIKQFWGMGLGTEAARGWLEYGFNVAGLERIVAVAVLENRASRRIMEKLGMRFEKEMTYFEEKCALYAISREEFLKDNRL
jgi:[ribosomal protein S5]-alanine N-acetyltransferase